MVDLAKIILERYKNEEYKHSKILKIHKGKKALDGIKALFFPGKASQATTWAKKWTLAEKSRSILIIWEDKLPRRKLRPILRYQFIIGDQETGSSLGSHWETKEEGQEKLKELGLV